MSLLCRPRRDAAPRLTLLSCHSAGSRRPRVPHPCQNTLALAVIDSHSGDGHRLSDLDSRWYQ